MSPAAKPRLIPGPLPVVALLALIALAALALPGHVELGGTVYLPLHTAMETFAVVAALLVCVTGIDTQQARAPAALGILAAAFLAVGLLDFGHALSYQGMPDFVTAASPQKAIHFWLAARLLAALALLAVALCSWQRELNRGSLYWMLGVALAVSALSYWLVLFHADRLPAVMDDTLHLTPFKRGMEYLIVALHGLAAWLFYRRRGQGLAFDADLLFAAVAVMGLGELFFAAYESVTDTLNLLGHTYKILGYALLYRAVFSHNVRAPYTRLLESQRELRASEERYRLIVETAAEGIWLFDQFGTTVYANQTMSRILGYPSAGELIGRSVFDFLVPPARGAAVALLSDGTDGPLEFAFHRADGGEFRALVSTSPIFQDEERLGVLAMVTDLTEVKRMAAALQASEERFREIFERAEIGMVQTGTDGSFLRVNRKFCRIVGYPAEELLHMTFKDITHRDDLQRDLGHLQEMLRGERGSFTMEKRYIRKDGETTWVNLSVSPILGENGSIQYFIGVIEDISARKLVEQRLRELSAHLQTVREEEKASIAREIHDDLGGTLTALKMDLYWLGKRLPAGEGMSPLAERMESMSQLLDNAVGVTRRIITELRPTILDDLGLLAAIEWQAEQFRKRTGIDCRVHCQEDLGVLGKAHSIVLFRILQEALTNVTRHSGASRVDIEFRHDADGLFLAIRDNGCGMLELPGLPGNRYGIRGMLERAASLGGETHIESPPEGGLSVVTTIPLKTDNSENAS